MRLIEATRFGDPDVLVYREAPDIVAAPGQVVVDVHVADTLHLDTVIRRGAFPFPVVDPPYVPGGGVAGVVAAVGPGVDPALAGRRVVARTGMGEPVAAVETVAQLAARDSHTGGYAEQAAVPAGMLVPVPDGVPLPTAAALVNDGMTAVLLAEASRFRAGEWVLVTPAGGGVGSLLVQLAHAAGARVVGAARGDRKLSLVEELGAAATVDYERGGWTDRVRDATAGRGVDVVLDGVGGSTGRASVGLVAPGGRVIAYGAPSGEFTPTSAGRRAATMRSLLELEVATDDERRRTHQALAQAAAGRLRPVVGQTYPLDRAADAHRAIENRAVIGKTLLLTAGRTP